MRKLCKALLTTSALFTATLVPSFGAAGAELAHIMGQQDFTKKSPQDQIIHFRQLYDVAYEEYKKTSDDQVDCKSFYKQHISGLYNIMNDAIKMVENYAITPNPIIIQTKISNFNSRILYLKELAFELETNKEMSQAIFCYLNVLLAQAADYLKSKESALENEVDKDSLIKYAYEYFEIQGFNQDDSYWDDLFADHHPELEQDILSKIQTAEDELTKRTNSPNEKTANSARTILKVLMHMKHAAEEFVATKKVSKATHAVLCDDLAAINRSISFNDGDICFTYKDLPSDIDLLDSSFWKDAPTQFYVMGKKAGALNDDLLYKTLRLKPSHLGDFFKPIMILYTSEGLSVEEFVKQRVDYDYQSLILQFDIQLHKVPNSNAHQKKATPHWGNFNTTQQMLGHDIAHIAEMFRWERAYYTAQKNDFTVKLKEIYNLQKLLTDENEKKIILNALFIFLHEFDILTTENTPHYDLFTATSFGMFIEKTKTCFKRFTSYSRSSFYKTNYRDLEFIFKDVVDAKGNHFISTFKGSGISSAEKQKHVAIAYDRYWDMFKNILIKGGVIENDAPLPKASSKQEGCMIL